MEKLSYCCSTSDLRIFYRPQIMRVFKRIHRMLVENTDLRLEIEKIKDKLNNQDKNMEIVFRYLNELVGK